MTELEGELRGIGLPALLRLLGDQQASGHLRLTFGAGDASTGDLWLDRGRVVAAACGATRGAAAVEALALALASPHGAFAFSVEPPPSEGDVVLEPADLLRLVATVQATAPREPADQSVRERLLAKLAGPDRPTAPSARRSKSAPSR